MRQYICHWYVHGKISKKIYFFLLSFLLSVLYSDEVIVLKNLGIDAKTNGLIVKLNLSEPITDNDISAWQAKSGWFYMTLNQIGHDSSDLSQVSLPDDVLDLEIIQNEKSIQIGLKMRQLIENYEFSYNKDENLLISSLHYSTRALSILDSNREFKRLDQTKGMHEGIKKWLILTGTGLTLAGSLENKDMNSKSKIGIIILISTFIIDGLWKIL